MFTFAQPEALLLLLTLPLLALWRGKKGAAGAVRFSSTHTARQLAGPRRASAGRVLAGLRLAVVCLAVVALARPQMVFGTTSVEASGVDIMLALDVSGSMQAHDFTKDGQPSSRLEAVKDVVKNFVKNRPDDRMGLVAFARRPFLACPLTLDHDWLETRLDNMDTGQMADGTAIGAALASSANRLDNADAKSRILILLTDGMNNAGKVDPLTAAEAAAALGIKVYTIGAGVHGEAPVPVTDDAGRTTFVMARVDIDEDTLTRVAEKTGGKYFRATNTRSLEDIYAAIDKMEKTTRNITRFEHRNELFFFPALLALLFLGGELLASLTRFRRLP